MKIIYKQGDLLECSEDVIVHGCNAQGVMGSGVAKAIKEKYPTAFYFYQKEYKQGVGYIIPVNVADCKVVINAITQEYYGRNKNVVYADYDGIAICFRDINKWCKMKGVNKIALPKIGAGLANGDWNIIEKIIEEECTDVQPVVYVLEGELN